MPKKHLKPKKNSAAQKTFISDPTQQEIHSKPDETREVSATNPTKPTSESPEQAPSAQDLVQQFMDLIRNNKIGKLRDFLHNPTLDQEFLKYLLDNLHQEKSDDAKTKDDQAKTPLMLAAQLGNKDILQLIIDAMKLLKIGIDHADKNGETALIKATRAGKLSSVKILLVNGATPELSDLSGKKAIHFAAMDKTQDEEIFAYLLVFDQQLQKQDKEGNNIGDLLIKAENYRLLPYIADKEKLLPPAQTDLDQKAKTRLKKSAKEDRNKASDKIKKITEELHEMYHTKNFRNLINELENLEQRKAKTPEKEWIKSVEEIIKKLFQTFKDAATEIPPEKFASFLNNSLNEQGERMIHFVAQYEMEKMLGYFLDQGAKFYPHQKNAQINRIILAKIISKLSSNREEFVAKFCTMSEKPATDRKQPAEGSDAAKLLEDEQIYKKLRGKNLAEIALELRQTKPISRTTPTIVRGQEQPIPSEQHTDSLRKREGQLKSAIAEALKQAMQNPGSTIKVKSLRDRQPTIEQLPDDGQKPKGPGMARVAEDGSATYFYPGEKDKEGRNALHHLAIDRITSTFFLPAVTRFKVDVNEKDNHGKSPLHYAAFYGNYGIMADILTIDEVDFLLKDADGFTAVELAKMGYKELLKQPRDTLSVEDQNKLGNFPKMIKSLAKATNQAQLVNLIHQFEFLKQFQEIGTAAPDAKMIEESLWRTNAKALKELLTLISSGDIDINTSSKEGATLLITAAKTNNNLLLQLLIDNDADQSKTDAEGMTAAHWAVIKSNSDVIRQLIQKGAASFSIPNAQGLTAFDLALMNSNFSVVKLLIEKAYDHPKLLADNGTKALSQITKKLEDGGIESESREKYEEIRDELEQYQKTLKARTAEKQSITTLAMSKDTKAKEITSAPYISGVYKGTSFRNLLELELEPQQATIKTLALPIELQTIAETEEEEIEPILDHTNPKPSAQISSPAATALGGPRQSEKRL